MFQFLPPSFLLISAHIIFLPACTKHVNDCTVKSACVFFQTNPILHLYPSMSNNNLTDNLHKVSDTFVYID